ncbi:hypothetical protein ACI8AF_15120 [Blastococcus sp. SYSU D00669]
MGHPLTTRVVARTVVVGGYVLVLAVAGRPGWLAALLGLLLVGVWAAPFLLATNRRPADTRGESTVTVIRGRPGASLDRSEGE